MQQIGVSESSLADFGGLTHESHEKVSGSQGEAIAANVWFPWCGVLINTRSLEVRCDYSRYVGNYIGDTLCVDRTAK